MASASRPAPAQTDSPAKLSRRSFLRLAGVAAAGGALSACAPFGRSPAPTANTPVRLVYQDWRTEWFPPMAQQMLARFHEAHPNIRVFYTPDPESPETTMGAVFEAGTAPDVVTGCCDYFPAWAHAGYLLDLRSYVAADLDSATLAEWDPAQYRAFFAQDGRQFGLPKYHGALGLYFNKDLFDEYRATYPDESWTFVDYLDAMRRLTRDRDGDGQTDLWGSMIDTVYDRVQVHVNAWGGRFVDPGDPTRCRMADPEAVRAIEWLRARMWDDRVMPTALAVQKVTTREAFYTGRVAMVEDGSWALKDILKNATFRIGVAPFPAGPARRVTLATTDGYGIFAGTKHPDAAWELVKFLTGQDYGRAMARANFLQPARASLVDEWAGFIRAEFPNQAKEIDIAAFADGHLEGYSVTAEAFADMNGVRAVTDAAWEEILTLGQAPVEARMQAVREAIERIQQGPS